MAPKHQTLTALFDAIAAAIRGKTGGTAPIVADDFPEAISGITTGVELPALSNPAGAAQILSGYEAIDGTGAKMTGTIASKTASNVTVSGRTVTIPAGYYPSQVSKSIATATQATPSISVSSTGLITASATQSAGYVTSGTKSATKQLTTQAAQTITPGTTDKTIASGRYLTGTQTIKGDANLVAENIKSGVSIFGVAGSVATTGKCTIVVVNESAEKLSVNIWKPDRDPGIYGVEAGQTNSFECITPMLVTVSVDSSDRVIDNDRNRSEFVKKNVIPGIALSYTIPADATVGQIVIIDY